MGRLVFAFRTTIIAGIAFAIYCGLSVWHNRWSPKSQRQLLLQKMIHLKWLRDRVDGQQILLQNLQERLTTRRNQVRESRRIARILPTDSDIYCLGTARHNRTCRVRNLCMCAKTERFFLLRGSHSFSFNEPTERKEVLDLTTLNGHNVFFWDYEETLSDFFVRQADKLDINIVEAGEGLRPPRLRKRIGLGGGRKNANLTIVRGKTYVTKRFYPVNIMHVFHDDWLGLYGLRDIWPSLSDPYDDYYNPLAEALTAAVNAKTLEANPSIKHGLVVSDHHAPQEYDVAYEWLGKFYRFEELLGWPSWPENRTERSNSYVCYSDAVVGNWKGLAWYQYGYGKPQGPIPDHTATGWKVREAALYALRQMGLGEWDRPTQVEAMRLMLAKASIPPLIRDTGACIAIFSRKSTRIILNEDELAQRLQAEFDLPICWIRLEEHKMPELVAKLKRAVMAFGMHGSLLVLAMFLPPGAVLIEGYPYGVPAENYTPYQTLANLPGMLMGYRAWTNHDETASIGYPDRPPTQGGLKHLSPKDREFILQSTTIPPHSCCDNPHWLYRIFQDTRVNIEELIILFREALRDSFDKLPLAWRTD